MSKVLVTGGRGFVATDIVKLLLKKGYNVHATARKVPEKSDPGVTWFGADLLTEGAFDEAIAGCEFVQHTASPYTMDFKDAQKDLVDPAVKGTINVLRSAKAAGTVKRVVLTSSMAAITDSPEEGKVYDESVWNEASSLTRNPYYFSKAEAERAAWKFMEEEKPGFDLVVVNPCLVLGSQPSGSLNQSLKVFQGILEGEYPGVLDFAWTIVDVEDVGVTHVAAMENEAAEGRYFCANETVHMRELCAWMHEDFADHASNVPTRDMTGCIGTGLAKFGAVFQPKATASYIRTNIGRSLEFDNSKVKGLGIEFVPVRETLRRTVQSLIDRELIPKAAKAAAKIRAKREKK